MLELNKVLLTGRLTRDPELRYIPSGTAVCDLRIASGRTYYDKNASEKKEETLFINVTAWGKSAEFCSQYFTKGKAIYVEGRLKLDQWEQDGQKRDKISVVADRVQFVESKASEAASGGGGGGGDGGYREQRSEAPPAERGAPAGGGGGGGSGTNDDLPF